MSEQHRHFAALAARIAGERDRAAFTELFDFFAPRIKAYLRRLGMEDGAAEDIAQDVMIVLWHKAHLFDPAKSSLSTWLFRVARNRRIDALRRDRTGQLDPDEPMLQPAEATAVDVAMDAEQRDDRVRRAMAELPGEQVELVKMAFFLGYSHSRIAEQTGLPLGTVKSRIRLAFGRLRRALEQDDKVDTDF
ncbi:MULTISPECIES: sigma-70 family RNA polymerase sigma factor [unclassified Roseitalea]|uniref:sigma-70 family RNA polymerase sigma factor n=1 Tax=unclassified Roseitalea TaxID=2639107 RepID=UPI00273D3EA3|nr:MULTISPECIES: sigma-70 family RNA polymerase sigma factor [unclassified Roseitalea]